jgi:hypothetical protein
MIETQSGKVGKQHQEMTSRGMSETGRGVWRRDVVRGLVAGGDRTVAGGGARAVSGKSPFVCDEPSDAQLFCVTPDSGLGADYQIKDVFY